MSDDPNIILQRNYKLYVAITKHRERLARHVMAIVQELQERLLSHDESKLDSDEFEAYASVIEQFEKHPFGTKGYNDAKKAIAPAVKMHYAANQHHPEHYADGIDGMDLVDLIEMICDWNAATLNHPTDPGDIQESLKMAVEKYKISPQLEKILLNTIVRQGWTKKWGMGGPDE